MKNLVFYLGIALLFTHELDAMPNHEWHVLPFLSSLSDSTGELVFVLAHIPIFMLVLALVATLNETIRSRTRIVASGFLVIHATLHYLFSDHIAYEFYSILSSALIYGASICGLSYLFIDYFIKGQDS